MDHRIIYEFYRGPTQSIPWGSDLERAKAHARAHGRYFKSVCVHVVDDTGKAIWSESL
jgi:hypothetical protein